MEIVIAVIVTLIADWGLGTMYKNYEKRQHKRDVDLFYLKLDTILENQNLTERARVSDALELCRNTKGAEASGAYMALDSIAKWIDKK